MVKTNTVFKKIETDSASKSVTLDTSVNRVYIVENGQVESIILPAFGTIKIPLQNHKIGNITIEQTFKRA